MSLRWRLLLTLGLSFAALWGLVAVWLYSDLQDQVRDTLDQRLAASARMVAGLVAQLPESAWQNTGDPVLSVPSSAGVACQINAPSGRVLMRTHGQFDDGLESPAPGFTDRDIDGERWRLFTYVQNGVHITTADRLVERSALQRNVIAVAAVPFAVALLGSLVVLWFGIRRGLRPLERLRGELSRRAPDTLTPVEIDDAPTELRPAVDTLNQLLVRTGETLAREQRFTSDAAHELRTPLTAIKTHVQLAKRLDGDKAYAALAQAEAGIARLQRTLEQLLLLARVEAGESHFDMEQATSSAIATAALADLLNGGRVGIHENGVAIPVAVPKALATAALRNLLDNALRHTRADREVSLAIELKAARVTFVVCDQGDWPADRDTQPLTQRFWRGAASRAGAGSGLGLTIAAAIAERFAGELVFEPRPGGGLAVRLSWPRAALSED